MKKLCVFYNRMEEWIAKPVQWIVCQECQKKLRQGKVKWALKTTPRE